MSEEVEQNFSIARIYTKDLSLESPKVPQIFEKQWEPKLSLEVDVINVSIIYPGASPSDIEESICVRVEERLQGLEGIKKITSTASENLAVISVEILPEQDVEDMLDKVKAQVDAINTFPDDIEKPTVQQIIAVSEAIGCDVAAIPLLEYTCDLPGKLKFLI